MLRLFASHMTLLNASARFFRPSIVGGNASLPESAFRSIPMRLTEHCATICVHLKKLGLIDSRGHGRGAVWLLGATPKFGGEPNEAE